MSTKTTIKRIALVAVSALGFGLLSVVPANAAINHYVQGSVTLDTAVTTYAARVGNQISIPVTGDIAANTVTAGSSAVLSIAAAMTEQPASSSVYAALVSTGANVATGLTKINVGLTFDGTSGSGVAATTAGSSVQTASQPAQLNMVGADNGDAALTADATVGTIRFTPTHVGTYKVVVWNEKSQTITVSSEVGTAGAAASLTGAESYQTFTIIVSAGVSSITLTPWNATSVEEGAYGSLVKVEIKDASGNAAALAAGESISIDPSGSGLVAYTAAGVTGSPSATSGATAGGAYSLSASDFSGGVAYVNITDADAETVSLVASLSSNSSVQASTALTFAAKAATAATVAPKSTTTGWVSTGSAAFSVPQVASVTFAISAGSGQTTVRYPVTVTDVSGKVTGKTGGVYDVAVAPLGTFSVAATFSATSTQNFTVGGTIATSGANTAEHTFTVAAVDPGAAAVNANITDTVAFTNSALRVAPAGTASFAITVSDQWGNALPNATVTLTWAGRNTSTAATQKTGLTNADGQITLSYTDTALSTVTATADTVTATAVYGSNSSTSTATVNWLATTVGTVTLTSTGDTDTVAGTTKTDISAGVAGATATSATASAVVKDANGVIIVGTPVTFVVSGLVGAEVHTTTATVYTDSTGTAVANISSYAAGKATVTATAGTISATDDVYFSQQTLTEARTISAVANGGTVTATVKDRYGNPIKGVYVYATRTGSGYFGNGASSSSGTTNVDGQIDFVVTGAASVTVALGDSTAASTTYGQSADAADKVGTTAITAAVAGTATTNQVGLGASLAPAGINSVVVDVTGNSTSSDAIDAANEATDAANAATDAANAAAEAADAATAAAQDAQAAVAALATEVAAMISGIKAQIIRLTNLVVKIQKKVKA